MSSASTPGSAKSMRGRGATRGKGRGGNGWGGRRIKGVSMKVLDSTQSNGQSKSSASKSSTSERSPSKSEDEDDDMSEEEMPTPNHETLSGRKVQRPTKFNPVEVTSPPRKKQAVIVNVTAVEARKCKMCKQGHSPPSNMIVFCDGCNSAWHQLCHEPTIDNLIVQIAEAEWFCKSCDVKRGEKTVETGTSGIDIPFDVKKTYLASRPISQLVDLLFFCEAHHPELKIYAPDTEKIVAGIRGNTWIPPVKVKVTTTIATTTTTTATPTSTTTAAVTTATVKKEKPVVHGKGSTLYETALLKGTSLAGLRNPGGKPKVLFDYEPYVIGALKDLDENDGTRPKSIWEWIVDHCAEVKDRDVRSEAQGALQRAQRSGQILRVDGHRYKINPNYDASKPAVRRRVAPTAVGATPVPPKAKHPLLEDSLWIDDNTIAISHRHRGVQLGPDRRPLPILIPGGKKDQTQEMRSPTIKDPDSMDLDKPIDFLAKNPFAELNPQQPTLVLAPAPVQPLVQSEAEATPEVDMTPEVEIEGTPTPKMEINDEQIYVNEEAEEMVDDDADEEVQQLADDDVDEKNQEMDDDDVNEKIQEMADADVNEEVQEMVYANANDQVQEMADADEAAQQEANDDADAEEEEEADPEDSEKAQSKSLLFGWWNKK